MTAVLPKSAPDLLLSVQTTQLTVHRLYACGPYCTDGCPTCPEISDLTIDLPTDAENLTSDDLPALANHISVLTTSIPCSSWLLVAPRNSATLASLLLEQSLERLDRLVRLDPNTILMNNDMAELAVA